MAHPDAEPVPLATRSPTPFHAATVTGQARELIDVIEAKLAAGDDVDAALDVALDEAASAMLVVGLKMLVTASEALTSIAHSLEKLSISMHQV